MDNLQKTETVRSRTSEMELGKTTYVVTTTFNENARETVEQKLVRYIAGRISSGVKNSEITPAAVKD